MEGESEDAEGTTGRAHSRATAGADQQEAPSPFDIGRLIKYLKDTYQAQAKERKSVPNQGMVCVTAKKKKVLN